MVVEVMGKAGMDWAVFAIVLVLLSTITTTFLDIFSAVVSTQNLWPGLPDKVGNLAAGVLGTLIALFLDVFAYEPFLLAIGAIFLPAFTIVLADYYWIKSRRLQLSQVDVRGGAYWYTGGFNLRAVVAWLAGFLAYDWASGWSSIGFFYGKLAQLRGMEAALAAEPFSWGQSIPCIIVSALSYWLLTRVFGSGIGKKRKR
jgi:purine-cytosine permease-like protein